MLLAVMRHPGDADATSNNAGSVGPGQPVRASDRHRGLNENLARECLELHTVSPAAGYTQADVTNFARMLTGWSIDLRGDPPGFRFRPSPTSPGTDVMGRSFPEGEEGGVRRCTSWPTIRRPTGTSPPSWCGISSPTSRRLRRRGAIEGVLRDTRRRPGRRGRCPDRAGRGLAAGEPSCARRWTSSSPRLRALDLPAEQRPGMTCPASSRGLGQPMWNAPQPNGWPDRAADWAAPEAMMRRIDWAYGVRRPRSATRDAAALAEATLGPLLSDDTLQAVHRAGSRRDAMTLLLTSPNSRGDDMLQPDPPRRAARAGPGVCRSAAPRWRWPPRRPSGASSWSSCAARWMGCRRWCRTAIRRWPGCAASSCRRFRAQDGLLDLGGFYGLHPALTELHAMYQAGELAAGPCRRRALPGAQPFRGAGLSGKRRRPSHDQRLAQPRGRRAADSPPAGPKATRWRSASRCPCCCAVRPRSATGRRTASPRRSPTCTPSIAALNQRDPVIGPGDRRGPARRAASAPRCWRGDATAAGKDRYAFPALAGRRADAGAADGPRVAALEIGGWDTHVAQVPGWRGLLSQLDAGLAR